MRRAIPGPLKHLLYVGRIARLTMEGSRFHDGNDAHLIKSRARVTELRHYLIWDGAGGRASYELDLPNGGNATLIGNILGKSTTPTNPHHGFLRRRGRLLAEEPLGDGAQHAGQ